MQKLTNLLVVLFVAFFACQSIATESPLYEPKDKELENKYKYEEFSAPPFPFMIERPLVCERSDMLISKLSSVQAQVPVLNGMGDMVDRNSNEEFQVKIFVSVNLSEARVLIPVAFNPVVFPIIFNPLAVTTPTESTLVTSS